MTIGIMNCAAICPKNDNGICRETKPNYCPGQPGIIGWIIGKLERAGILDTT